MVEDPNANDVPVVYVAPMEAQEDRYPPFLMYENSTNTIIFRPISEYESGQTFYFIIVVKEQNSDTVKFVYYCTLNMKGEIIVRDTTINYTLINYTINWIGDNSEGSLKFNKPVNMTFIYDNFAEMFKVFWRDTNYRVNRENRTLMELEINSWGAILDPYFPDQIADPYDSMTMNFTMTFA